jgi:hypothetical protein
VIGMATTRRTAYPDALITAMRGWLADMESTDPVDPHRGWAGAYLDEAHTTDDEIVESIRQHYPDGICCFINYIGPQLDVRTILVAEDAAEDEDGMEADHRLTCHTHQSWVRDCATSRLHVNPVTGHNWCLTHRSAVTECACRPAAAAGM